MEQLIIDPAARLAVVRSSSIFMTGLITGVWSIMESALPKKRKRPYYTNIAHRAALLYSSQLFCWRYLPAWSALSDWLNLSSVAVLFIFFFGDIGYTAGHKEQNRKPASESE